VTDVKSPLRGALLLLAAAFFWGVGFYAQRLSLTTMTPLWATSARFVLAVPLALIVLLSRKKAGVVLPWREGILCGVVVAAAFALQTVAMLHTPVSRVALITGLYAVLTPLLQPFFGLSRPRAVQLFSVFLAMVGTTLLCGVLDDSDAGAVPPNLGDALTLVMAFVSAFYVLFLARKGGLADPLALNAVQVVAMSACSLVVAPVVEGWPTQAPDTTTWISVTYLAIASTFFAFLLQMLGQRHVTPSTAAVLMLLETPIGVGAAVFLLGETMTVPQWAGAGVAIVAVVVAVWSEHRDGITSAEATPPVSPSAEPSSGKSLEPHFSAPC
jgi:drug/metabolite transporter (DMT)-like permease